LRLVGVTNILPGGASVVLSIALVRKMGLIGVALGTLAPVSVAAVFVVFPIACRRVHVPVSRALAEAVWPAVWPAIVMAGYISLTRAFVTDSLSAVAGESIIAGGIYAATFLFLGIRAAER